MRFQPDTLWQALMRFFDMAAPDANVYVEIPAPDIRFAAIVVLALVAGLAWRRLGPERRPTFALVALLLFSAALWLASTGNGRYFMAMLVCAGPLAVALVCLLPVTRGFKGALVVLLLAGQAFVFAQQPPWNSWTLLHWGEGSYFGVSLGPEEKDAPPTTYASLSLLSYSLIAPQFPPQSRWINLQTVGGTPRDEGWTDAFLRRAAAEGSLKLLAPSMAWAAEPDGTPKPEMVTALGKLVAPHNLRISGSCHYIDSPGMLRMAERQRRQDAAAPPRMGFWTCPMAYEPGLAKAVKQAVAPTPVLQALEKLSELCPRFFSPGEASLRRLPDAWMRAYPYTQTRAYVLDDGQVLYQFWRSLNPVAVGTVAGLLAGEVQFDCLAVRSDGPWRTGAQ